ncbi:single-stranded DNA-binding protein [Arthrobacter sp. NPDC090010]|uniref:single-stranded DNA-binding protein n=1 Tax=Arthrobacter sp. NPDC090010 TaxID=3363942 RepID=UPI00381B52E0
MADSITIRGFVAGEVRPGVTSGGVNTASFRMGSTDRHYDRATQQWVDGETNWFTVQAYRQLAGNIAGSVRKGQRVVVLGRLKLRQWRNDEGKTFHVAQIEAESIGHDLSWGTANYQRNSSLAAVVALAAAKDPGEDGPDEAVEQSDGAVLVDGMRVDPATGEVAGHRDAESVGGPGGGDGPVTDSSRDAVTSERGGEETEYSDAA